MAKPSKGKKALKSSPKAARENAAEKGPAAPRVPEKAKKDSSVVASPVEKAKKDSSVVASPVEKAKKDSSVVASPVEKPKKDASAAATKAPGKKNATAPELAAAAPAAPASPVDRVIGFVRSHVTIVTIAIALLMAVMFLVRTVPVYSDIFTDWPWIGNTTYVNVAMDDGVYHMRLLNNLLEHFPFRILYDPFTHFPYGNTIHFGPLFEIIPAAFLLLVGLGSPSQGLVDTVAAYYPAVLGTLVIIPVYYIGKKLFGRLAGLIAALALAFLPGAFLFRTLLGAFDHHAAEILFIACTVACLVYALDAARAKRPSLEMIRKKDWAAVKMPIVYSALAGVFLGCYMLSWVGALLLAFVIFAYFTLQAFIDNKQGLPLDSLVIMAAPVFLIPAIMVLPYSLSNPTFSAVYYSITQPLLLVFAFLGVVVEYAVARVLQDNKAEWWAFPAAIVGIVAIALLLVYLIIPGLFVILQYSLTQLVPSGGTLTISEAWPTFIDRDTGKYSFDTAWDNYYWAFPSAIAGLVLLVIGVLRFKRPGELLFLVWSLVMTWALVAQNRFTYYWGLNAVLLLAYLAYELLQIIEFDKYWAEFKKKVNSMESLQRFVGKKAGMTITVVFIGLFFLFVSVYPALPISDATGANSEGVLLQTAENGASTMPYEWYDALTWMRNHTPDPQGSTVNSTFDYTSGQYYKDASATTYDYPSSAYAVMCWWDYGHDIEYVAQRIPNANPFQAGIVEQNGTTGASPFFCSTDEEASVDMLDALGSRYVVIDNLMATGKFYAIQTWIGDTDGWEKLVNSTFLYSDGSSMYQTDSTVPILEDTAKWESSIMNRLYYGDADGMSHYRLVYESAGAYYVNMKVINRETGYVGYNSGLAFTNLNNATTVYDLYSNFVVATDSSGTLYGYEARPPVKYVKVFEKVAGATLVGSAPEGSEVTAALQLVTDEGRTFNYTTSAVAHNGTYSLVVPYPTERMTGDGYSYGILANGQYAVSYGNTTKYVDVTESAVMGGATVQIA